MTVSVIALSNVNAQTATVPSSTEKAAVDALIPWLLQEDAQLRGIPFSEVIFDSTGKHVLACNPKDETNARVLKQMSSVLDEVMARLNAPESPIQGIPRINEVSSHFEDLIRELLNKTPGLACDFPKTAAGGKQRSGYPDLELDRSIIASRLLSRSETLRSRKSRQFVSHFLFRAEDRDQQSARGRGAFHCWL